MVTAQLGGVWLLGGSWAGSREAPPLLSPPGKTTVAYVTVLEQVRTSGVRGGEEDGAGYVSFLDGGSRGRLV